MQVFKFGGASVKDAEGEAKGYGSAEGYSRGIIDAWKFVERSRAVMRPLWVLAN